MKKILVALMLLFSANVFAIDYDKACFYKCDGSLLDSLVFVDGDEINENNATDDEVLVKLLALKALYGAANVSVTTFGENATQCPQSITPFACTPICPNGTCAPIRLSKTFDFNVQSGGINANMYVCEVGFYKLCPDCTQHYLQVAYENNAVTTLNTTKIYTYKQFGPDEAPKYANVYINDLYWGAEFYVKYCVGVKRLVVGDDRPNAGHTLAYDANITPWYTIQTGLYNGPGYPPVGLNDYVGAGLLQAKLYKDCSGNGLVVGPLQGSQVGDTVGLTSTTNVTKYLGTDTLEICGTPGCQQKQCIYTLRFNETATCYRPLKCGPDGQCVPYESTIKTSFNADVTFDCLDGVCGN